jgi:hypothetical protein
LCLLNGEFSRVKIDNTFMILAIRLTVAGALLAASHLVVLGIHQGLEPQPADVPKTGPDTLPMTIGDYVGRDEPLDVRTVAASDADIMLNRVYRNRLGDYVIANIGIWTNYEKTIPHSPEGCYPAAGWEVADRRILEVPQGRVKPFDAKLFVFQRGTSRIAVAFWVQLGDETLADSEGIRQMRQRLRFSGGKLPPLVKVMLQTEGRDLVQAEARLSRIAASLIPCAEAIH